MKFAARLVVILGVCGAAAAGRGQYVMQGPPGYPVPAPVYGNYPEASALGGCANYGHVGGAINGGVGVFYGTPYFDENQAFVFTRGLASADRVRDTVAFDWDYAASPVGWIGWHGTGGLGIRAGGFYFNRGSKDLTASMNPVQAADQLIRSSSRLPDLDLVNPAGQGSPGILLSQGLGVDNLLYTSHLKITTVDVEATYDICAGPFPVMLSGGARYMYTQQTYNQTLFNTVTTPDDFTASESSVLDFNHRFQGAGPTIAIHGTRELGGTGFSLFGNFRAALLVGRTKRTLNFAEVVDDPDEIAGGSQSRSVVTYSHENGLVPTLETEVGLEYLACFGGFSPFMRVSAVNNTYFGAGCASSTQGNLGLFGCQITAGINY
jgi:hypothetical protein